MRGLKGMLAARLPLPTGVPVLLGLLGGGVALGLLPAGGVALGLAPPLGVALACSSSSN